MYIYGSKELVDLPTILSDLSIGTSEGTNVSHLDDGGDKIGIKRGLASAVATYNGVSGCTIIKLLVRVKEAFLGNEVFVVVVVE